MGTEGMAAARTDCAYARALTQARLQRPASSARDGLTAGPDADLRHDRQMIGSQARQVGTGHFHLLGPEIGAAKNMVDPEYRVAPEEGVARLMALGVLLGLVQ